jgi:hypothetical protein
MKHRIEPADVENIPDTLNQFRQSELATTLAALPQYLYKSGDTAGINKRHLCHIDDKSRRSVLQKLQNPVSHVNGIVHIYFAGQFHHYCSTFMSSVRNHALGVIMVFCHGFDLLFFSSTPFILYA